MDICWERADLLAFDFAVLLYAVLFFSVPFPCGVWEGSEIRLYRFLIIAFSSTFLLCCGDFLTEGLDSKSNTWAKQNHLLIHL